MLLRSFARDVCEKLAKLKLLTLEDSEMRSLATVNESALPKQTMSNPRGLFDQDFYPRAKKRRFQFDRTDTLPYWYKPMLRMFSNLDGEEFLDEVERWIFDVWSYEGDVGGPERRGRLRSEHNWALRDHRHGTVPTLERLDNHLEWHAMWCAVGSFLTRKPLIDTERAHDDLSNEISSNKLISPPMCVCGNGRSSAIRTSILGGRRGASSDVARWS